MRILIAVLGFALFASACTSDPQELTREEFDAILIGADDALDPAESDLLDRIADRNAAFSAALGRYWDSLDDPEIDRDTWLGISGREIELITDMTNEFSSEVGALTNGELIRELRPVVDLWIETNTALFNVREAVESDEDEALQEAVMSYNNAVEMLRQQDQQQIDRAVEVIGEDATREQLVRRGLNPARFGL